MSEREGGETSVAGKVISIDRERCDLTIRVRQDGQLVTFEMSRPGSRMAMKRHVVSAKAGIIIVEPLGDAVSLGSDWCLYGIVVGHKDRESELRRRIRKS